jgi:hypothetical protein
VAQGDVYGGTGRFDRAEEVYQKALAIQERLTSSNPGVASYLHALANTHYELGYVWEIAKQFGKAAAGKNTCT